MAKRPFAPAVPGALPSDGGADDEPADGSRTLIERAYTQLRDDIIAGALTPGEKLRVEHLKLHYGVGAGTLREAITRLVSDALVVTEGQRGFRVAPVAIEDLEDLTRLRVHIEIDALRHSIRQRDAQWRERLRESYERMSAFEQPIEPAHRHRWEALNTQFHEDLMAGHDSPWTRKLLRVLARHGERYRRYAMALPGSRRDVHAEHAEIFRSAMAGNELRAALALEEHVGATLEVLKAASQAGVDVFQLAPASYD